tara:strand:- start:351 stop:497 length:147 start_codon:yes stop_codon:yes gene_type:complete
MKFKLKDGKISEDMFWLLRKIAKKATSVVEKDKGKQYYNGHMILIGKN